MLRSITAQMCRKLCKRSEEATCKLEEFYKLGTIPNNKELIKILSILIQKVDRAYIIIDALDECLNREVLFKVLSDLLDISDSGNIRVFVSSRDLVDFRNGMAGKYTSVVTVRDYEDKAEIM